MSVHVMVPPSRYTTESCDHARLSPRCVKSHRVPGDSCVDYELCFPSTLPRSSLPRTEGWVSLCSLSCRRVDAWLLVDMIKKNSKTGKMKCQFMCGETTTSNAATMRSKKAPSKEVSLEIFAKVTTCPGWVANATLISVCWDRGWLWSHGRSQPELRGWYTKFPEGENGENVPRHLIIWRKGKEKRACRAWC